MMIIAALILFCYIAIVSANESVLITGNEKVKDFILYNNSRFTVFLEAYPGYTWILDNVEEVKKADIEPIDLVPSHYGNEPNAGEYINGYPQDESMGGYYYFNFKKNDSVKKEYPPLKFIYKNNSDKEANDIQAQVNLIVGEGEPLSLGLINDPTSSLIKIEEDGGEFDLYVNNDSANFIMLYGSISGDKTLSSGYSWYLENEDLIEFNKNVDLLQLDTFANKPGSYYNPMTTLYKYVFQVKDYTAKDILPTLVFSYKESAKSKSIEARAVVHLRSNDETVISFDNDTNDVKKNLNVNRNEILLVELKGNPSTGYNWMLDNVEKVKEMEGIEVLNVNEDGIAPFVVTTDNKPGSPGVFRFKFQIKGDAEPGELQSSLKFIQARSKDDVLDTAELALRVKKERSEKELEDGTIPTVFYDLNEVEDNVIYVESNTLVLFTKESNPSTGCSWIIKNKDEIDRSDYIDYVDSTYKSSCNNIDLDDGGFGFGGFGVMSGCGGDETFKFRIWDVEEGDELPEIHMVYGHSWAIETEYYETLDLVLKVKKSENENENEKEKEKEKEKEELPVIIYDKNANDDNVVYVESNTILQFTEGSNPSTGCSWVIKNNEEIEASKIVEYLGSSYNSYCDNNSGITGCGGDETFSFRIGEIQEGDELPEIHMVYGHRWAIDTEYYETLDLVLKVKKSENEKDCSMNGYKCCTKANPKVHYQDKDGDWGVEHGEWCYINKEEEKEEPKEEKPQLIRTCTGESKGYPCCKREHSNVYTDKDGQWAVENGEWCGIATCTYTGDYPVCQKTTKVVYTDSLQWGVENKQWCVLCL